MHVITGIKKNPPTPLKFCGYKEGFMNHSTIDLEKKNSTEMWLCFGIYYYLLFQILLTLILFHKFFILIFTVC